jgi:hypothetical protein
MPQRTIPVWLSAAFLLPLTSCDRGPQAPASAAGSYTVDRSLFGEAALTAMRAGQRLPEGRVRMDLDLATDGTFRCRMGHGEDEHEYTGRWLERGSYIELNQTHQDGEEVSDKMRGTLDRGLLRLTHKEEGLNMPYVLSRRSEASAPR